MTDFNEKDIRFVKDMVKHHEAAIKMAASIQKNGKNKIIKKLASNIEEAQTKEIDFMKDWLEKNKIKEDVKVSTKSKMNM